MPASVSLATSTSTAAGREAASCKITLRAWVTAMDKMCSFGSPHRRVRYKPARTIQSLLRAHWRNALAATVNRLTACAPIRVMPPRTAP